MSNRTIHNAVLGTVARVSVDSALTLIGAADVRRILTRAAGGRVRLAVQAYSVHLAHFFGPVLEEIRRRMDAEIFFIAMLHPHFPLGTLGELRRFADGTLGIPASHTLYHWQTLWMPLDLVLYTDVYARFPWRARRHAILMHGAGLQARMLTPHPLRKSVLDFDLVLVNGEFDARRVRAVLAARGHENRVAAAGFPFLDRLMDPQGLRSDYVARLGLDASRPIVLVAPHWTVLRRVARRPCYLDEILQHLSTLDVNVVLKLHACSFNERMGGPVDWHSTVAAIEASGVARVDRYVDDTLAIAHCDALITDMSSRAFAGMTLGKPVVLYEPSGTKSVPEGDEPRQRLLEQGATVAATPAEVADIIERARRSGWTNPAGLAVARECYAYQGQATRRVGDLLEALVR